ncbi:MAG: hypothetical protein IPP88_17470 [Betaproteobacteria bacterium]|nr:hypothetical protein [Betaproteobacteria bacterium]
MNASRKFFASVLLLAAAFVSGCATSDRLDRHEQSRPIVQHDGAADALIADIQRRTFNFFWETTNPQNGLVHDRFPTPAFASVAAVGFGLTAYPIGVERGYVTREQARKRVLTTLRFFHEAPQGTAASGMTGYKGFFYHFVDMKSGARFETVELSTIDTALFVAGALFCQSYFDGTHADEVEIRDLADRIYRRIDWQWAQPNAPAITHGWKPETGFLVPDYRGYNEAMIVYLLALGSPTFPVKDDAWKEWTRPYDKTWKKYFGQEHLGFPPLFGHQYTHTWIDFRNIQDAYMKARGMDYFENTRRATYAQQAYAMANPLGWKGYGENLWGVSASDGPVDAVLDYRGRRIPFHTYAGRGMGGIETYDDGTIAPTAAISSLPFAPEIVIPAIQEMHTHYGTHIYSTYGFLDSFNPSFQFNVPLGQGKRIPGGGWVAGDYLGIDQGPILAMIENYRSELVWRTMRKNPYIRRGLERAGFTGGWLSSGP